jgi:NitT/TauT family transport system substrate-binding protein
MSVAPWIVSLASLVRRPVVFTALVGFSLACGESRPPPAAPAPPVPSDAKDAAPPSEESLRKASLYLLWIPQAQFAGYYMAEARGLYRARGIDLSLEHGGPDRDSLTRLGKAGGSAFATAWLAPALLARGRGLTVVHLSQVVQTSNLLLVAWKDRGIRTIEDLDGRSVAIWDEPFLSTFLAFFGSKGVEPRLRRQHASIAIFLRRGVDACAAMEYNEYHDMYQSGVDADELTTFRLGDHGFAPPEDGLYCLEATLARDPDLCRGVVEASLEGWRLAAEKPDEALAETMLRVRKAHVPANLAHMRWMLRHILDSVFPAGVSKEAAGRLDREAYLGTVAFLRSRGLLLVGPAFEDFARMEGTRDP